MTRPYPKSILVSAAALTFAIVSVCSASQSDATTLRRLSVDELSVLSDTVVVGNVSNQRAAFEGGVIWTTSTVDVESCWAGPCGTNQVEVHTPGGVVGDIEQRVSGLTPIEVGDTLVLFLVRRGRHLQPVSFGQGTMRVDLRDGQPIATELLGGSRMLDVRGMVHESSHRPLRTALATLRAHVVDARLRYR